ncbi:MAG: hypothetical protein ACR2O3_13405 [Rhizobiaceae bacterium]
MDMLTVFGVQFLLSIIVFAMIGAWLVRPWLYDKPIEQALFWLVLPHAFRHLGLVFLVPGVVAPSMAANFANAAAYGDLAAGLLAVMALIAIQRRWSLMLPIVWLLNIVGTVDLLNALRHTDALPYFQSAWYIPTFVVPLLLVTHFMMFALLTGKRKKTAAIQ